MASSASTEIPADVAKSDEGRIRTKRLMTEKVLKAEPKVRVRIPAVHNQVPVNINGVQFLIKAGTAVDVPSSVATVLEESGYI